MRKFLLLPLILLLSCDEIADDIVGLETALDLSKNTPVISNVGDVYSLVVNADNFSLHDVAKVEMDSALVLSLTVAGYSSGTLYFLVYSEDSLVVFDREVSSNVVISEFPPYSARSLSVSLQDFSGKVSLSLTED